MAETKKAGDVLAKADFRVHGEGWNGPVDMTVHAELFVSWAFQYGNQTGMRFIWSDGRVESFDTRYENVSAKNFTEFAKEVLDYQTRATIKVEVIQ